MQAGLKLVVDCPEEDILVAMLASLSKLSYKSTVLVSEQVSIHSSMLILCVFSQGATIGLCLSAYSRHSQKASFICTGLCTSVFYCSKKL